MQMRWKVKIDVKQIHGGEKGHSTALNKWRILMWYAVHANTSRSLNRCWTGSRRGEKIAGNRFPAPVTFRLPNPVVLFFFYIIALWCKL